MLMDGVPPEEVAMRLGICMETLRKYQKRIAQGGLDALRKVGTAGRPTVLDDAAYSWIAASLIPPDCTVTTATNGATAGCGKPSADAMVWRTHRGISGKSLKASD